MRPEREKARRLLRELVEERGYPARMIAEHLGIHESQVSRFLHGKVRRRSRLESPESLEALERLLGPEGEELFRRWVLAKVSAEVMRRLKEVSAEEALAIAGRLLPSRLQAYRRRLLEGRGSRSADGEGEGERS